MDTSGRSCASSLTHLQQVLSLFDFGWGGGGEEEKGRGRKEGVMGGFTKHCFLPWMVFTGYQSQGVRKRTSQGMDCFNFVFTLLIHIIYI